MKAEEALRAEARAANPPWPWERPGDALERLIRVDDWDGDGVVTVTDEHLVFEGARRQRTSIRTVRSVERDGNAVWVRRRNAHDWLVRFDRERDARRVEVLMRRAVVARRRR